MIKSVHKLKLEELKNFVCIRNSSIIRKDERLDTSINGVLRVLVNHHILSISFID